MIDSPTRSTAPGGRPEGQRKGAAGPRWAPPLKDNLIALVLAMIVLVPLVTGTSALDTAGKLVTFEALGALLLAVALSQVHLRGAAGRLTDFLRAGPNLPVALLLILTAVSALLSPYKGFSLMELMRVGFCTLLYFVLVYQARGKGQMQTLTDGLLAVTAAVSVIGFLQMGEGQVGAVASTFGSHELLGSFLMLMLPVALALGLIERGDAPRQTAAQVVAVLAGACLLMARTRSAWLGTVVSLVALSVLALRYLPVADEARAGRKDMLRSLRQRKHLIVVPLLVLVGAMALLIGLSQTGGDLKQRAGTLSHVADDDSFRSRMALVPGTLHMIRVRPAFGWGAGTYPVREAPFTGFGDDPRQVLAHGASHNNLAHNFYLQTAAETGLVGLGLYLAVIIAFFAVGLRALWALEGGLRKAVLIGCLAAMAGQIIDAFGSPAYNFASVSLFQWVLMGLGMSAAGLGGRATARRDEADLAAGVSAPLGRGLRYAACGLAALGIMTQIVPTVGAAFADTCTVGGVGTFRTQTSGLNVLGPGQSTNVGSTFNGRPAHGVRYTIGYSPSPDVVNSLVTITRYPTGDPSDYLIQISRNATPAPTNGATITVRAVYIDSAGRPYQNFNVTIQLN